MRTLSIILPIALLALIGCSSDEPATNSAPVDAATATSTPTQTDSVATTFVSLKVPNMV